MKSRSKLAGVLLATLICAGCATTPTREPEQKAQAKAKPAATRPVAPKITEQAPKFKLATLDKRREIDSDRLVGKEPVLLFFGSYT